MDAKLRILIDELFEDFEHTLDDDGMSVVNTSFNTNEDKERAYAVVASFVEKVKSV